MKKILLTSFITSFLLISCNKNNDKTLAVENDMDTIKVDYADFGAKFDLKDVKSKDQMTILYSNMKEGDTLNVQFESEIIATCKKKGCWMSMNLGNEEKAVVKFKNYEFFVPKEGAEGKTAIVNGKAYLAITSVDELKHDAKDGGKPQSAIDSIVSPKVLKMFMADGALITK